MTWGATEQSGCTLARRRKVREVKLERGAAAGDSGLVLLPVRSIPILVSALCR